MTTCNGFCSSTLPGNKLTCHFLPPPNTNAHESCLNATLTTSPRWWFSDMVMVLEITEALPVHCFFTSLVGMGLTAIRYFGSASWHRGIKLEVIRASTFRTWRTHVSVASLTNLSLIWLSVLGQLNELLGEHAAAVAQDVALKLGVSVGEQKLHYDGVSCGVDADFHVLASHWGGRRGHCSTFE